MTPIRSRFDILEIAKEVQRARIAAGMDVKTFAAGAGIGRWSIYKKEAGEVPYSIEELGRIAEMLGAPTAWPFVTWKLGQAIDHRLIGTR